jgi:hypothetical protein
VAVNENGTLTDPPSGIVEGSIVKVEPPVTEIVNIPWWRSDSPLELTNQVVNTENWHGPCGSLKMHCGLDTVKSRAVVPERANPSASTMLNG